MKKSAFLFVLLFIISCSQSMPLGSISGVVYDEDLMIPLMGVRVGLSPSGYSKLTDSDGYYCFNDVESQEYTLSFSRKGYHSYSQKVRVDAGKSAEVQIGLHYDATGTVDVGTIAVPEGLIAFYSFDKSDFSDGTAHELDGVVQNAPSYSNDTPNGKGKAIALDWSKKQFVNIPYNPFKGLVNYTITFWIKDFSVGMIFSAISDGDKNMNYPNLVRSDYPRLLSTSSGTFRFFTGYDNWDTTSAFVYDTNTLMSSGWHHIGLTCSGNTRNLFIDGKFVDTNTGFSHGEPYDNWTPNTIQIGGDKGGVYSLGTNMMLDNLRFYSLTLPKDKIYEIYESER